MRICVIGTGYVGLVAGTCLAESGNDVICVDSDEEKVKTLSSGSPTIYEPGLSEYLRRNIRENRLSFTKDLQTAVKQSEVVFIAVGTPTGRDNHIDLSSVLDVAGQIGKAIEKYTVVVTKSTVPAGTAKHIREIISSATGQEFSVVSNPEFLKEGAAVDDFMKPERVIIGTDAQDTRALETMRELYAPFLRTGKPLLEMGNESAEICKYACNCFLATKISFMNQMAGFCEAVGANITDVRKGMGSDPRIGPQFLFPGVGFGGSCFPKDIAALENSATEAGASMDIVRVVREINELQKLVLVKRVKEHFNGDVKGKKGAIWGLSFKPRTDDIREAPSLAIIQGLLEAGASLSVFDPVAMTNAKGVLGDTVEYAQSNYLALKDADFLAVVTEWNEFRRPDFRRVKELMRQPVIFDGRNIYTRRRMEAFGFTYYGIGC